MQGKGGGVVVEWLWIGGGEGKDVGGRVAVEWGWIHGGEGEAALQQQLCGSSFVAVQRQWPAWRRWRQLYFSAALATAAAVASLAAA